MHSKWPGLDTRLFRLPNDVDMDAASSLPWLLDIFYRFHQDYTIGGASVLDAITLHSRGEHRARFLRVSANASFVSSLTVHDLLGCAIYCYNQIVQSPKTVTLV